jgi:hypothetical protein
VKRCSQMLSFVNCCSESPILAHRPRAAPSCSGRSPAHEHSSQLRGLARLTAHARQIYTARSAPSRRSSRAAREPAAATESPAPPARAARFGPGALRGSAARFRSPGAHSPRRLPCARQALAPSSTKNSWVSQLSRNSSAELRNSGASCATRAQLAIYIAKTPQLDRNSCHSRRNSTARPLPLKYAGQIRSPGSSPRAATDPAGRGARISMAVAVQCGVAGTEYSCGRVAL